jgi:predicted DCC family thiol-disulfide oxidoreductase YuxK
MNTATVLYDGDCQFCKKLVCFAQSKLKKNKLFFLAFGSIEALKIAKDFQIKNQNSVVFIQDNVVFLKSRAVLKICKQLQFPYNCLWIFKILPTFLLDFAYNFIAKRRIKLTHNKQCCNG